MPHFPQQFPAHRPRRNRKSDALRQLVAEHHLTAHDLLAPVFVEEGTGQPTAIASMPGVQRYPLQHLPDHLAQLQSAGIRGILLFAKIAEEKKDNNGTEALNPEGLLPRAIRAAKAAAPDLLVMTDVALDPFSSYGHDGIVEDGEILNDRSVELLAQMSLVHARAGADLVAPSDMMDGRIGAIRRTLNDAHFSNTGIMSYAAKYASAFYGPFRDALDSAPGFGDKKTYQMHPANRAEALRETALDLQEGADLVMVKPGLPYLDIVREVKSSFQVPTAVYQVSGEYAMQHAAAAKGWLNLEEVMLESLLCFKRAGADLIATYFALPAAQWLQANGGAL